MSKIDLNKPIEAVHKITGRVVPMVYLRTMRGRDLEGDFYTEKSPCTAESNAAWHGDGSDFCWRNMWFVRNVAEEPKVDWTKPLELSDGTPVELVYPGREPPSGGYLVEIPKHSELSPTGLGRRLFLPDGRKNPDFHPKTALTIRNRQESPAMSLDISKPLQTRDGRSASFISRLEDGRLLFTVGFSSTAYAITQADGRMIRTPGALDQSDIINKPIPPVTTYRNLYEDGSTGKTGHRTFEQARDYATVGKVRIGVIEITKQDGVVFSSNLRRCAPAKRDFSHQTTPFAAL